MKEENTMKEENITEMIPCVDIQKKKKSHLAQMGQDIPQGEEMYEYQLLIGNRVCSFWSSDCGNICNKKHMAGHRRTYSNTIQRHEAPRCPTASTDEGQSRVLIS